MNYAVDADLYTGWAEAMTSGRISTPIERRYNAASIFKRAQGVGRITHYGGLERLLAEYGDSVVALDLLPVGAPRRDWRATLISDGMVIVRHPELSATIEIADRFAADLQLYAAWPPEPLTLARLRELSPGVTGVDGRRSRCAGQAALVLPVAPGSDTVHNRVGPT